MRDVLTDAQWQLLFKLAYSAGEHQVALVEKFVDEDLLSDETDELCDLISNAFLMDGIEPSFEPNAYGRDLEDLLDGVNRKRLR